MTDPNLATSDQPYTVVARRYRPQAFNELIGQDHVSKALCGAITSNRVGHAYLFTGARGVGKTSAARIFAKALNCEQGPAETSCNACDICESITAGADVDVIEIDGASNRGIDEIRQLRQNAGVRPSRARYKIYIIDEVHMLTREAFNALLKTLEEPPEHVKFIFCTTEANKIPITILSRCQRFDFAGVAADAIIERLMQICDAEGVKSEPAALADIARRANGSMRDSQSLLEQLLGSSTQEITAADVQTLLGTAGTAIVGRLVDQLVRHDAAAALAEFDEACTEGVDPGQLVTQLLDYLRDAMVLAAGGDAKLMRFGGQEELEVTTRAAEQLGLETTMAAIAVLDQTLTRMRQSTHVRTLVEIALVRICRLENLDTLAGLIADLKSGTVPAAANVAPRTAVKKTVKKNIEPAPQRVIEKAPAVTPTQEVSEEPAARLPAASEQTLAEHTPSESQGEPVEEAPIETAPLAETVAVAVQEAVIEEVPVEEAPVEEQPIAEEHSIATDSPVAAESQPAIQLEAATAAAAWKQVVTQLHDEKHLLASHAECSAAATVDDAGCLVVSFSEQAAFHRSACERPDAKAKLEQSVRQIVGSPVRLRFDTAESIAAPVVELPPEPSPREQLKAVEEHPMVKRAGELFGAEVVGPPRKAR